MGAKRPRTAENDQGRNVRGSAGPNWAGRTKERKSVTGQIQVPNATVYKMTHEAYTTQVFYEGGHLIDPELA